MISAFTVLASSVAVMLLGLFVVYGNHKDKQRRYFFVICVSLGLWQVILYASENISTAALWTNRLVFLGPLIALWGLWLFIQQFKIDNRIKTKKHGSLHKILKPTVLVTAILSASPLMVLAITERTNSDGALAGYDLERSLLYYFYLAVILLLAGLLIRELIRLYLVTSGSQRTRVFLIFLGFFAAFVIGVFTNVILPIIIGGSQYSYLGAFSVLAFVSVLAFAIVKHKIIDVQAIVARALGYIFSVLTIYALFGLVSSLLIEQLMGIVLDGSQKFMLAASFVIISYLFAPIQRLFNKLTNRVFFRDSYDVQEFIDLLNKSIVSSLGTKELLSSVSGQIVENLKSEYVEVRFSDESNRSLALPGNRFSSDDVVAIGKLLDQNEEQILVVDSGSEQRGVTVELLRRKNAGLIVSFGMGPKDSGEKGYMILGVKKNGNPYNSQDIKVLEIVSNELVIAIQNALRFEEIQQFNLTLQHKIDDATRDLRRANEKLKALDETKDEFISMASHQLRTPLTSVKGYLSMVLEGDAGKVAPEQEKLLKQAFFSSQRMVYLISDLLNVSRLRTGKFIIEAVETDLPEVIEGELSQLEETAQAKGLKLKFNKPKDFPKVMLDETKIRQVIMNFVDNAIYYSPDGGDILIELEDKPQAIEFRVIDSGIGVPKSQQHELFGKFYRAENARRVRPDGTGLGLFMAKKVVIAQGGAIIFKSVEGKGSTFGFTFPKSKLKTAQKT